MISTQCSQPRPAANTPARKPLDKFPIAIYILILENDLQRSVMSALRKMSEPEFTVPQVSAMLSLPPKAINNLIDRELGALPGTSSRIEGRTITAKGLLAIELLAALAQKLVPGFRLRMVRKSLACDAGSLRVDEDGVVVELAKHREKVDARMARLRQAEAMVESSNEVLSGTPCILGTRLPVHLVAALAGKHGTKLTLTTYPTLTANQVDLAVMYAQAHPRRGRPATTLPKAKGPAQKRRVKKVKIGAAAEM
jgi:uncharacterized protein (DUF433 family)